MRRRLTTLLLLMLLLLWAITELQLQLPELETNSHFSGRLDSSSFKKESSHIEVSLKLQNLDQNKVERPSAHMHYAANSLSMTISIFTNLARIACLLK